VETLHQVSCVEEVVGDVAPFDEGGLLKSNQSLNKGLEPHGQVVGEELHDAVLQGDGMEPDRSKQIHILGV
jgi:hypothetical protein